MAHDDTGDPRWQGRDRTEGNRGPGGREPDGVDASADAGAGGADVGPGERIDGDGASSGGGTSSGGGARWAVPRGLFWLLGVAGLAVVVVAALGAIGRLPSLDNPFAERTNDRSQPVLLRSIQDLSRFVAAEGSFEVIVDLQNNRRYLPDALLNDRTLVVAAGTVEAYVDFGSIDKGAVSQSDDRRSVTVELPAPQLGEPNLDSKRTYVFAQQRGLLNRVGDLFDNDPDKLSDLYRLAEDKIAAAARGAGLTDRAESNARKTVEGLLTSLGYTTVTVRFRQP